MNYRYTVYSDFLSNKYGTKVYKLPIKLDGTCPNREEGCGCHFCGEEGGSFENLDPSLSVKEQLTKNKAYIAKKYNAKKFIAYFQNYTNTYIEFERFKKVISAAIDKDIVAIYISTRPDCISNKQLEFLESISKEFEIDIVMEIGLQTINYKILRDINRGHGLAEFIDSVIRCKTYGIDICVHVLIGLPGEEEIDVVETAKLLSTLKIQQVKLHALYVLKDTVFGELFENGKLELITKDEYIDRVILFLRFLDPQIVVQRLIGRSPLEDSLFSNWSTSWWKIRDEIIDIMDMKKYYQGDLFDYLEPKEV